MKKTGIELIADERHRQIEIEGWTAEHDVAINVNGELARAATCYVMPEESRMYAALSYPYHWPLTWDQKWWKPTPNDRIRELTKAGALIAAEIDRLQNQ